MIKTLTYVLEVTGDEDKTDSKKALNFFGEHINSSEKLAKKHEWKLEIELKFSYLPLGSCSSRAPLVEIVLEGKRRTVGSASEDYIAIHGVSPFETNNHLFRNIKEYFLNLLVSGDTPYK